jgi:hypothetical protein
MISLMASHPVYHDLPETYLPEDYIRGLKRELDAKRQLLLDLPGIIEALSKRFDAALVFAPPGFDASDVPNPSVQVVKAAPVTPPTAPPAMPIAEFELNSEPTEKIGWRKGILELLEQAGKGVTHQDLIRDARERFNLAASNGEKAFYNAVSKLTQAGNVTRHGNLLYASTVLDRLKAENKLPDVPPVARRPGSSAEYVVQVLAANPAGLNGNQLRQALAGIPEAPKSLSQHGQYIYNVLAPMIGTGEVTKENGVYRLSKPVKSDE